MEGDGDTDTSILHLVLMAFVKEKTEWKEILIPCLEFLNGDAVKHFLQSGCRAAEWSFQKCWTGVTAQTSSKLDMWF